MNLNLKLKRKIHDLKKTKYLGLITFCLKRWNSLWSLTIRINIYTRWTKGSIDFSGYGKDFGKNIRKLRFRKGLVVIFAKDLAYLGVIKRGKQKGARVVSECLDDLRVSEVIKWFSVFNRTEPTTITPRKLKPFDLFRRSDTEPNRFYRIGFNAVVRFSGYLPRPSHDV